MEHSARVQRAERELKAALVEEEAVKDSVNKSSRQIGGEEAGQTVYAEEARPLDLEWIFSYHPPSFADHPKYTAIRSAAKYFASVIVDNVPACADRSAAIRKLREAVMTANAAIALGGRT